MKRVFTTLVILGLIVTGLQAQPERRHDTKEPGRARIMEKLNLTDAQKKQMAGLRTGMQKQSVELRSQIQLARIDLRELLGADDPDKAAIAKKVDEIGSLQTKQKMARIDHWFDVKKVLTPDQQKIWKSEMRGMLMEHRGMMRNRRGIGMMDDHQGMPEMPGGDW